VTKRRRRLPSAEEQRASHSRAPDHARSVGIIGMSNSGTTKESAVRRFLGVLGPGLITGASDDDPSGIGTYSQAGAQFGLDIGWTMLLTYPLMAAIQEISARIGRTTGHGIAGNLCRHYPGWLLRVIVPLLFIANTINIGADLSAMADATKLLIGGPNLLYVFVFGGICVVGIVGSWVNSRSAAGCDGSVGRRHWRWPPASSE
jgi:Mn2+/Fe2+ NRAMP family transporter